jgi:hypothetical protein
VSDDGEDVWEHAVAGLLEPVEHEAGADERLQEVGEGKMAHAHSPAQPFVAREARRIVGPGRLPVAMEEHRHLVLGHLACEGPDEARMQPEVHEAPAGNQHARAFPNRARIVAEIGVREDRGDGVEGGSGERQRRGVGLDELDGVVAPGRQPQLIRGDVDPGRRPAELG